MITVRVAPPLSFAVITTMLVKYQQLPAIAQVNGISSKKPPVGGLVRENGFIYHIPVTRLVLFASSACSILLKTDSFSPETSHHQSRTA
ncbi:hypothetical protein ACI2JR_21725 [Klebsiella sp. NPDC088457]